MNYKVLPIMYGVSDHFKSTIRFSVEFVDDIDKEALQYAVVQVGKRYPYFKVRLQRQGEEYVLTDNEAPLVISEENAAVCLGSQESSGKTVITREPCKDHGCFTVTKVKGPSDRNSQYNGARSDHSGL